MKRKACAPATRSKRFHNVRSSCDPMHGPRLAMFSLDYPWSPLAYGLRGCYALLIALGGLAAASTAHGAYAAQGAEELCGAKPSVARHGLRPTSALRAASSVLAGARAALLRVRKRAPGGPRLASRYVMHRRASPRAPGTSPSSRRRRAVSSPLNASIGFAARPNCPHSQLAHDSQVVTVDELTAT